MSRVCIAKYVAFFDGYSGFNGLNRTFPYKNTSNFRRKYMEIAFIYCEKCENFELTFVQKLCVYFFVKIKKSVFTSSQTLRHLFYVWIDTMYDLQLSNHLDAVSFNRVTTIYLHVTSYDMYFRCKTWNVITITNNR